MFYLRNVSNFQHLIEEDLIKQQNELKLKQKDEKKKGKSKFYLNKS